MQTPLPARSGHRPATTTTNPHRQLDQNAPTPLQEALWARMAALPGVLTGPSLVSVLGARALFAGDGIAASDCNCVMKGSEFAHLHPPGDGSLHVALPEAARTEALAKGWAEPHPLAALGVVPKSIVMLFGPRDEDELDIVWSLVCASYAYATGETTATH